MSMETDGLPKPDNVIFGEIQVLLAEKRTALASLRTGIAVFVALLQHGESDASPGATDAPEPWSGRAWHVAWSSV